MIMDNTSKNYYESVMRDYKAYARGRSLEQYCRDEAVEYNWILKAQKQYGDIPEEKPRKKATRKSKTESTDLIRLHFEEDKPEEDNLTVTSDKETPMVAEEEKTVPWKVESLKVISPSGGEIEIRTSNLSAVSELLAKLTA